MAVVDERAAERGRLRRLLEGDGLEVVEVGEQADALRVVFQTRPDAAVITLHQNDASLIRILHAACDMPIVALAPTGDTDVVVRALDAGADDVIPGACDSTEIMARVRAARRRYERKPSGHSAARMVQTGRIEIDRDARLVSRDGEMVRLSNLEYRLLDALASRVGQVAPHRLLLSEVWGDEYVNDVQYLRVYMGYLRQKLEDDPKRPQYLVSEWGVGYRLAKLPIVSIRAERDQAHVPALAS